MSLLPFFVLAFLIAVNALYVAAEFSAVAVQRSALARLARDGNTRASGILALLEDGHALDRYIAACQIGITLSSLVAGAYGQATVGLALGPILEDLIGLDPLAAASTAALTVLLTLTALQVVLGELVPKSLALQYPEQTALASFLPTRWSVTLFHPFIAIMNGSALLVLKPFGVHPGGHQHVHSPNEIKFLLAESQRGGGLAPEAHRRLQSGLHLSQRTVRQLMIPRSELIAVEASMPSSALLELLRDCPYSRLPVYEKTLDQIIGAVDLKDVVGRFAEDDTLPAIPELLRPMPFVPEHLTADRLVRFLQERRASKAIVVDEFGVVQGIVSMEDVLAELFGQVTDELKEHPHGAERLPDGRSRLPGSMPLVDAERWLGVSLEGSAATLGGFLVEALEHLPAEGEKVRVDGVELAVTTMGPTTVKWIEARPVEPEGDQEEESV